MMGLHEQPLPVTTAFVCGVIGLVGVAAAAYETKRHKRQVSGLCSLIEEQKDDLRRQRQEIGELGELLTAETRQRAEERKGRTEAERRLRAEKQAHDEANGYNLTAIGTISTPFRDRRGTPRQGSITPLSRGKVLLDSSIVGYPALIGLADFSHVWLLFVFHDNTNAVVNGVADDRPSASVAAGAAAGASGCRGGGAQGEAAPESRGEGTAGAEGARGSEEGGESSGESRPNGRRLQHTFLTKVIPPRLGKKVGVLGTRSPHRPNPVGLTMVKLEGVDLKTNSIMVSGVDLVDGTPIIDVKPVIPHDVPDEMKVPDWVEEDPCLRRVVFDDAATEGIETCIRGKSRKSKTKFYSDVHTFKGALTEVLVQDVRSVHQGRGMASNELYECFFDGVIVYFITTVDEIIVLHADQG